MIKRITAVLGVVGLATVMLAQSAFAQYPPPSGSLTSAASATSAQTGEHLSIACVLRDTSGAAIADKTITFVLNVNPGDASLDANQATTDAAGVASVDLDVGTRPGLARVSCTGDGLSSSVLVEVLAETSAPPAPPSQVTPPSTGDAGLAASGALRSALALPLSLVLLAAGWCAVLRPAGRR